MDLLPLSPPSISKFSQEEGEEGEAKLLRKELTEIDRSIKMDWVGGGWLGKNRKEKEGKRNWLSLEEGSFIFFFLPSCTKRQKEKGGGGEIGLFFRPSHPVFPPLLLISSSSILSSDFPVREGPS